MPTINFDGADKVILGSEADKVYLGYEMVWEEKEQGNLIVTSARYLTNTYSYFVDIKPIDRSVDASKVTKVEIGDRWVVDGSDISLVSNDYIRFNVRIGDITGGDKLQADTPIKIYYK